MRRHIGHHLGQGDEGVEKLCHEAKIGRNRRPRQLPPPSGTATDPLFARQRYTAAETVALPTLDFACQLVGVPYKDDHTNIKARHDRMSARDSAGA
ncbi:hypothetical protein GCM10011587_18160 [Pyruvatibacter mobilis]|nr:hypothetical protein GCM10011587_18160 [Pyruvatibacter mobilis]